MSENLFTKQNLHLEIGDTLVSTKDGFTYTVIKECSTNYYLAYFNGDLSNIVTAYKFWNEEEFAQRFVKTYREYLLLGIKKAEWSLMCAQKALERHDSKVKISD